MNQPTPVPIEPADEEEPLSAPRDVRRANRRLLAGLILFALALCGACLLWMYGRMAGQREAERKAAETLQTGQAGAANPLPSPVAPR